MYCGQNWVKISQNFVAILEYAYELYETKMLFCLVIETVEREEESPVISDLVFP